MKKIILLLAVTTSIFAKFPHENDSKITNTKLPLGNKTTLLKSVTKIDNMQFDHTEGKILAAMYNMKVDRIDDLRQELQELLMRASTVEKLNMDTDAPINIEDFIVDLQKLDKALSTLDADSIDFKDLDQVSNELENKTIEFESLISHL